MGELYTNKKAGWESGLGEEGEVYQVYGKAGIAGSIPESMASG